MRFREIEFKYNANDISLTQVDRFCKARGEHNFLHASGYDYFYRSKTDPSGFCRHRVGPDSNQLTFKRKLDSDNNYIRTEHNIDLEFNVSLGQVKALCAEFGYKPSGEIFKNCFIYKFGLYTIVYYVCYDLNMKELGRFVEIEMSESHAWTSDGEAWAELRTIEKEASPIGISPQARMKRSLFEMFGSN